ncbi:hypothetical protein SLE2022_075650 [Rubroshorea leprosula]
MTERARTEGSTPLATVEEIQKRLLRPSSLHPRGYCEESQPKSSSSELPMTSERGTTERKLEEYLDPVLLSAICAKIGRSNKDSEMKMKRNVRDFEWPVDELKVFVDDSRTENGAYCRNSEVVVDLNSDTDVIGDCGDGEIGTPFQHFEQTALKRFKRSMQ